MEPADIASLRSAVDDLGDGDVEPLIGLMADDMVWHGVARGWLWRRHRPH